MLTLSTLHIEKIWHFQWFEGIMIDNIHFSYDRVAFASFEAVIVQTTRFGIFLAFFSFNVTRLYRVFLRSYFFRV